MPSYRNKYYPTASDVVEKLEWQLTSSGHVKHIFLDGGLLVSYLLSPPNEARTILAALSNNPIRLICVSEDVVVPLPDGCSGSDLNPLFETLSSIETWQTTEVVLNRSNNSGIYQQLFESMSHVTKLTLQGGGFSPKWLSATLAGLCSLPCLTKLCVHLNEDYDDCIASLVPKLKVLKEVSFGTGYVWPPDRPLFNGPAMQNILRTDAPIALELIQFVCTDPENWQAFCEGISLARIHSFRFDCCQLGDVTMLKEALVGSRLKGLHLDCCDFEDDLWLGFSHALGALAYAVPLMPFLEELVVGGRPMSFYSQENPLDLVALVYAAAKCPCLQRFQLNIFAYDSALDEALAHCLATNGALQGLEIKHQTCNEPGTPKFTGSALCMALTTNYTIQEVALVPRSRFSVVPWDVSLLETVQALVRLNNAGRGYMASDPSNRQAGVCVLEQVADNLDCLFLHLKENPLLCRTMRKCRGSEIARVQGRAVVSKRQKIW